MSKVCSVCGKKPAFGHNRSHSMVATKRRFDPNLQRVRVLVNGVGKGADAVRTALEMADLFQQLRQTAAAQA